MNGSAASVRFQFHKGTIRTLIKLEVVRINSYHFNSIKVRLELIQITCSLKALRFQFHKGTIRT